MKFWEPDRNTYQILGCHIVGERAVDKLITEHRTR
jgi:hypothetical protein